MQRLPHGWRQPGWGGVSSLAAQQAERTEVAGTYRWRRATCPNRPRLLLLMISLILSRLSSSEQYASTIYFSLYGQPIQTLHLLLWLVSGYPDWLCSFPSALAAFSAAYSSCYWPSCQKRSRYWRPTVLTIRLSFPPPQVAVQPMYIFRRLKTTERQSLLIDQCCRLLVKCSIHSLFPESHSHYKVTTWCFPTWITHESRIFQLSIWHGNGESGNTAVTMVVTTEMVKISP